MYTNVSKSIVIVLYFTYNLVMDMKTIKLRDFEIGGDKLTIIAGPCAAESPEILEETAKGLREITKKLGINFIFKSSFDKANRSSIYSYRGPGLDKGLEMLQSVKDKFDIPIVTDIHTPDQAEPVSKVADILQIPAFLCRQTDLLVAAANTGKIVNVKKGQFLAPEQMSNIVKKLEECKNNQILLTERGSSFGYNNLVVDYRGIPIMQSFGYPVVFDATHSVQLPGANGTSSGGDRRYVPVLAKAAVAAGVNALFFEVHPDPENAKSDGPNMIPLGKAEDVFSICKEIFELIRK